MKLALCNEMFEAWNTNGGFDFPRVFEFMRQCGYEGVELAPFTIGEDAFHIPASKRAGIRTAAEHAELEILGLHWILSKTRGYYLTSPDRDVRKKTAEYFLELIRLCSDLGGNVMVLGSPQQRNLLPGVSRENAMDFAAEVLGSVVPLLETTGVCIALEPLSPAETDFLENSEQALELLNLIDAPQQVGLHLDCKAMFGGEKEPIPDVIRKHEKYLKHFHLNDPNLRGPGFGNLDFVPIMQALKDIGYTGWTSVEVFDYSPGIEKLARESCDYIKDCITRCS